MKPYIDRTNLQPITVKVGLTVSLDVNIIGEPPPKVTWTFKDKELISDDTIRIDNVDYNTKFFILKTKRAHTGKYVINAKNEVGEDTAEVEITVLGKPSKPKVRILHYIIINTINNYSLLIVIFIINCYYFNYSNYCLAYKFLS